MKNKQIIQDRTNLNKISYNSSTYQFIHVYFHNNTDVFIKVTNQRREYFLLLS